jgi:hypothetical protein
MKPRCNACRTTLLSNHLAVVRGIERGRALSNERSRFAGQGRAGRGSNHLVVDQRQPVVYHVAWVGGGGAQQQWPPPRVEGVVDLHRPLACPHQVQHKLHPAATATCHAGIIPTGSIYSDTQILSILVLTKWNPLEAEIDAQPGVCSQHG